MKEPSSPPTSEELSAARAVSKYLESRFSNPDVPAHVHCPDNPHAAREYWDAIGGLTRLMGDHVRQEAAPPKLDNFTIIRQLSHGGMGVVYEAQQHKPERRVALKVIRGGRFVDPLRAELFQSEIRAQAMLAYPTIAAVYECGVTATGEHYLSMELIDGVPIHVYCHRRMLDVTECIDLFLSICDGVHIAHTRGVIHRDLKPNNILVNRNGQPKILDFGVAHIMEHEVQHQSSTHRHVHGTLAYMSPERLTGDGNGVGVDVYALGVVLYEILTGKLPHALGQLTTHDAARMIRERQPRRPSQLNSQVRSDLDSILLAALCHDCKQRYATVADLADDLRRHQACLPIRSKSGNVPYRLGKFVQRHSKATMVTGLIMACITIVLFQALQLTNKDAQILRSESESRSSHQRMRQLLMSAAPDNIGTNVRVLELLEQIEADISADKDMSVSTKAEFYAMLGQLYVIRGDGRLAENCYGEALSLYGQLDPYAANHIADCHRALARTQRMQGHYRSALEHAKAALMIHVSLHSENHPGSAAHFLQVGLLHVTLGQFDQAEAAITKAHQIKQVAPEQRDQAWTSSLMAFGKLIGTRGGNDAHAESLVRQALAMYDQMAINNNRRFIHAQAYLAKLLLRRGAAAEARELMELVIDQSARQLGADHPQTAYYQSVLATILLDLGRALQAETFARHALEIQQHRLSEDHHLIGATMFTLGRTLYAQNRYTHAVPFLRESVRIRKQTFIPGANLTACTKSLLGQCLARVGQYDEAETLLQESLPVIRRGKWRNAKSQELDAIQSLIALYDAKSDLDKVQAYERELADLETNLR